MEREIETTAEVFARYQQSAAGRLRYELAQQNLERLHDLSHPLRVLDAAGGNGMNTEFLLRQGHTVTLLDSDPEMLQQAHQKLKSYPFGDILFLKPLPTQDFPPGICTSPDVITAIQAHHYLSADQRKKATVACYDLLKDKGVYVTFENVRPATDEGTAIGKNYWKSFLLKGGRDSAAVDAQLTRFDREFFPITLAEHMALLKETGFRVVELFWYSYMQAGFYAIK